MNELFAADKARYASGSILTDHAIRFLWILRKCQVSQNPLWRIARRKMSIKYGLEIPNGENIGAGLYLGHAFNITVNPNVVIGRNVNMHKGVTIGQENRGKRKGIPTIGDSVWIGVNSTIVGSVCIGSDVLIAPNAYVNRDVPDHSIAIGNPCAIIPRSNATEGYINREVD